MNSSLHDMLRRAQRIGWLVGLLGLLLCGLGWGLNPRRFFVAYLFAFVFWLGLSLGCLAVAMIHHLTGCQWGFMVRRFCEMHADPAITRHDCARSARRRAAQ